MPLEWWGLEILQYCHTPQQQLWEAKQQPTVNCCCCAGNGAGLGRVRERELAAAARVLQVALLWSVYACSVPCCCWQCCSLTAFVYTAQVPFSNVTVIDEPQLQVRRHWGFAVGYINVGRSLSGLLCQPACLQDGMQTHWPAAAVAQQVEQQLRKTPCDTVSARWTRGKQAVNAGRCC